MCATLSSSVAEAEYGSRTAIAWSDGVLSRSASSKRRLCSDCARPVPSSSFAYTATLANKPHFKWWRSRGHDPVLELRSRKLPERMTSEANQTATPSPRPVMCSVAVRERDPPDFNGTDENDAEDWLETFERVSAYNRWDDVFKLTYVSFPLTGVAEVWFKNNKSRLKTWAEFKDEFLAVFGRPAVRKLQAEQRLRLRAQQVGENFTSYIEDVLDLCRRVDPSMQEAEKIKHILKGIDDDAFQMLLSRDLRTVTEVINMCRSFDELRRQRALTRRSLVQNDCVSSLSAMHADPSLLSQIKDFVREEVARQLSLLPAAAKPVSTLGPSLEHVIRDQVAEALPPGPQYVPIAAPVTYANITARPLPQSTLTYQPTFPVQPRAVPTVPPPPRFNSQAGGPWRTPDNRPICFACGVPGHVARYCRRRPPSLWDATHAGFPPSAQAQVPLRSPTEPRSSDRTTFTDRRPSSPRRRSLSPMRRRPGNEDTEN